MYRSFAVPICRAASRHGTTLADLFIRVLVG
jgi:hypothetical protein